MSDSAFKNMINPSVVEKIGQCFKQAYPAFDLQKFNKTSAGLPPLGLKARVLLITTALKTLLPEEYAKASAILMKVLKLKRLTGFELWPVSEYISQFGLGHFDESLELMYVMTQSFTSEFAVRTFLLKDPASILARFEEWVTDENVHVRRWVSEGTRPNLPWGGKIPSFIKKPATLQLLEKLKYDEELYVRKSVANHLNDITKDHPELVVKTLKTWLKEAPAEHRPKITWIARHALRTLIKRGHDGALSTLGVSSQIKVVLQKFRLNQKRFTLGEVLSFEFELFSQGKKEQHLIVDYAISFLKANGSQGKKVFKLKKMALAPGEVIKIKKNHSLKKITTMTFYPGKHELSIQVNGKILKKILWDFNP